MDLGTDTAQPGRWVMAPRKGSRFLGPRERARLRARERRRKVFVVLLESLALATLIGIVPPLRPMLYISAFIGFLLMVYAGLVVQANTRRRTAPESEPILSDRRVVLVPEAQTDREPSVRVAAR
jgi:hypothetical protein